jgi:hypothetical protein
VNLPILIAPFNPLSAAARLVQDGYVPPKCRRHVRPCMDLHDELSPLSYDLFNWLIAG